MELSIPELRTIRNGLLANQEKTMRVLIAHPSSSILAQEARAEGRICKALLIRVNDALEAAIALVVRLRDEVASS